MPDQYYFQLGTNADLSFAELQAVFPDENLIHVNPFVVHASLQDIDPQAMIDRLGGTIKILRHLNSVEKDQENQLIEIIASHFGLEESEKVKIALGELGRDHLPKLDVSAVKTVLKKSGKKVRYVEGPRYGLSAAVLLHQTVTELIIVQSEDSIKIAKTVAVQDIDHWTDKDRGKPYADRKKGLLPPKVARVMVNLAVGTKPVENQTLLDPFCGTGTILIEALEMGLGVVGSDADVQATAGARENLAWFKDKYKIDLPSTVLQADATKFRPDEQITYLVTEPFLGKPKPKPQQIPDIFKGLIKLYLGSFKNWAKFLQPNSRVVIAFPRALAKNSGLKRDYTVQKLIDNLSKLGYITQSEPILYYRPGAVIARELHIFEYQPTTKKE